MLRKYQHDIKQSLVSEWEKHNSIMVQMPTGTGKTHLLAAVIYDWLKGESGKSVWIVAHRRELVEQIGETVARYGMKPKNGVVKVLSVQWLSRHWDDVKAEKPSLIVIDEAHHALAETYKELWLRYPEAKKLGMTATPCRLNRKGFTDLFEVLITSDSIADFIRQGWLSAFDYVSIRSNSEDQRLIYNLEKRGADGDFQIKEMNAVLNKRPSIERLYESVRQYADGKKGIVYAISINHARNIAEYYKGQGMNAVAIDSKTPAKVRKQLVEDFRQGKIQVLAVTESCIKRNKANRIDLSALLAFGDKRRTLEKLADTTQSDMEEVRKAVETGDMEALDNWVHHLRSSWMLIKAEQPLATLHDAIHKEGIKDEDVQSAVNKVLEQGKLIVELARKEAERWDG